jgi:hypothetical protein
MSEVKSGIQAAIDRSRQTPFEVRRELLLKALATADREWNSPEEVDRRRIQVRAVAAAAYKAGGIVLC